MVLLSVPSCPEASPVRGGVLLRRFSPGFHILKQIRRKLVVGTPVDGETLLRYPLTTFMIEEPACVVNALEFVRRQSRQLLTLPAHEELLSWSRRRRLWSRWGRRWLLLLLFPGCGRGRSGSFASSTNPCSFLTSSSFPLGPATPSLCVSGFSGMGSGTSAWTVTAPAAGGAETQGDGAASLDVAVWAVAAASDVVVAAGTCVAMPSSATLCCFPASSLSPAGLAMPSACSTRLSETGSRTKACTVKVPTAGGASTQEGDDMVLGVASWVAVAELAVEVAAGTCVAASSSIASSSSLTSCSCPLGLPSPSLPSMGLPGVRSGAAACGERRR